MAIRTDTTSIQFAVARHASSKAGCADPGIRRIVRVIIADRVSAGEPGADRRIRGGPVDGRNLHAGRASPGGKTRLDHGGISLGISDSGPNRNRTGNGLRRQRPDCRYRSRNDVRIRAPIDPVEDDGAGDRRTVHPAARRGAVSHGDLGRQIVGCKRDRESARVRRNCLPHHARRRGAATSADRHGEHAAGAVHGVRRGNRGHAGNGAVLGGRVVLSDPVQADPALHHAGQARGSERRLVRTSIWIDQRRKTSRRRSIFRR